MQLTKIKRKRKTHIWQINLNLILLLMQEKEAIEADKNTEEEGSKKLEGEG